MYCKARSLTFSDRATSDFIFYVADRGDKALKAREWVEGSFTAFFSKNTFECRLVYEASKNHLRAHRIRPKPTIASDSPFVP